MNSENPDYETIFRTAAERECEFVILRNTTGRDFRKEESGILAQKEHFVYEFKNTIGEYDIYQKTEEL